MNHVLTFELTTGEKFRANIRAVSAEHAWKKANLIHFHFSREIARISAACGYGTISGFHLLHNAAAPSCDFIVLNKNAARGFRGVFSNVTYQ